MTNINLFIPNINEINGFVGLILFIFVSTIIGQNISPNKKLLSLNFFLGYGIIYFFSVFLYVCFSIEVRISYYIILFLALANLILKFNFFKEMSKVIFKRFKNNIHIFFLVLPLFIIIFNSKALGWDTFSHWLPLANALDQSSEFLLRGHATNYPFASTLVLVFSSLLVDGISENVSALFSFFQLILIFELINYIIQKNNSSTNNIFIKPLLVLFIFYNPIHLNKFVYSSYSDFDTSVAILISTYLLFQFYSNYENKKLWISISVIGCLIVGLKNTGIVLVAFSMTIFFIISLYENFRNTFKTYLAPLILINIPILLCWSLWQYLLYANNMSEVFFVYDFIRHDLIVSFFKNIIFQINERKIFYYFSFIIILLALFRPKILKVDKELNYYVLFYAHLFIFWFIFLVITFIYHFNSGILNNATSFWRYNSQISVSLLFLFCLLLSNFLNHKNYLNSKKLVNIISILILILPIIFLYKLRRDLEPRYLTILDFSKFQNKVNRALVISSDSSYNAVRLNYYLNNDYRKSIVDYMDISKIKNFDAKSYSENNIYDLVILLDQSEILNFKKDIYIKK